MQAANQQSRPASSDLDQRLPFGVEDVMQPLFSVGQLVRMRQAAGGICEVVRILPVVDDGMILYVIRSEQGDEVIVRQHELGRA